MQRFIEALLIEHERQPTRLLSVLRAIQARYFHIPAQAIAAVAEGLNIARTQVIGVVGFYHFFSLQPQGRYHILISDSITDHMLGKQAIADYLCHRLGVELGAVRADGLVSVDNTSCTGLCDQGPAGLVNGYALPELNPEKVDRIAALIENNTPLTDWPSEWFQIEDNIQRADLLLSATVAPGEGITAAFSRGLTETLAEIERSGLRGRGGAGFNTAMKWRFCAQQAQKRRYVVCNADEGEPGTFKDRVLLNSYADQVIEGMTVAAALLGAEQGFIYLRGEYLYLLEPLEAVLERRRSRGLLGAAIQSRDFNFDIEIRLGAGAYICGEESALIESLEGHRGIPRNRPPYPVENGYLGYPTTVNNVETFVAAAAIAVRGGAGFAAVGTTASAGTKILSISGDCLRPGIYEYPFGTTIQRVLDDCGAEEVFGVQVGGPSGSFIADSEFDRILAFEDCSTGGSFMVFNRQRQVLDIVRNFSHFFAHESCGFCTPCRVGTSLIKDQIDKLCRGHASAGDLAELTKLGRLVRDTSHCGLGQTAANPMLSTLARFPEHYQQQLTALSFEPGFDLDASLASTRALTGRDDVDAHLFREES